MSKFAPIEENLRDIVYGALDCGMGQTEDLALEAHGPVTLKVWLDHKGNLCVKIVRLKRRSRP